MSFHYTRELIDGAFSYSEYRRLIDEKLALKPVDEAAAKLQHFTAKNVRIMDRYSQFNSVYDSLKTALEAAPSTIWLVITEGWCGDAAFNVPVINAIEKAVHGKIELRFIFRDNHLDVIDANLTDGGRSIPKMVILSQDLEKVGAWGPRPAGLQTLMKEWKAEGLELKDIILKVHEWYDADKTNSLQQELQAMVEAYS